MRALLVTGLVLLLSAGAISQEVATGDTVSVRANGGSGGLNATVWKADCQEGRVMTGIEILVGGSCHNQCDNDGRPVATYLIHCSKLQASRSTRPPQDSRNDK
jgi:hypothetical protein